MDRVWNGILVNNYTTPKMRVFSANNRILLSPLTGAGLFSGAQNGIKHLASFGSVINSNTITAFTVDTIFKINGVYSSMNTKTSVQCNSVVTIPRAFNFYSLNATTWWLFNRMNFNGIGLQLTYTATIGQQGGSFNPSDNIWDGSWTGRNGTWTYSSTAVSSKIFQRGNSFYLPPNNNGVPQPPSYLFQGLQSTGGTPANYSCSGNLPGGGGSGSANREIIEVAADSLPPQTEPDEIEQYLVYAALKADSLLLASNDTLQGFVTAYEQENLGQLSEVERLCATGDYVSAAAILSNFIVESNIQQTYKTFYELYIGVKENNDSIGETELTQLQMLALQCPFSDGEAVYKARALYSLHSLDNPVYNDDNCIAYGFSRSSIPDSSSQLVNQLVVEESRKIQRSSAQKVKIYPNPSSGFIYLSSSTGFKDVNLVIRDVTGRVLKTTPIPNGLSRFRILLDLDNGIYVATIIGSAGVVVTKRLIIQN
jgi:hypothetical protein